MNILLQLAAAGAGTASATYLFYRQHIGKRVHYLFRRTNNNFKLMERMQKNVPEFNPTIYLPNGYLKTISNFATVDSPAYERRLIKVWGQGPEQWKKAKKIKFSDRQKFGQVAIDIYRPDIAKEQKKKAKSTVSTVANLANNIDLKASVPFLSSQKTFSEAVQTEDKPEIEEIVLKPNTNPRRLVLIIPGFGTDSSYSYLYETVESIHNKLGWDVCVFNQNGVGKAEFKVRLFLTKGN